MTQRARKPTPTKVVLIGRGKMGSTLAPAFGRALKLWSSGRSPLDGLRARVRALRGVSGKAPLCWILAVRDRDVHNTVTALAAHETLLCPGDMVVHLAGILGPEVLAPAALRGAHTAAVHPLVAVASPRRPVALKGAVMTVEGTLRAYRSLQALLADAGVELVRFSNVKRARYHGGAALVATGAVALAQGAAALWVAGTDTVLTERQQARMAASLLRSVAHNVETVGLRRALASPLLRGDVASVRAHLEAQTVVPAAQALYRAAVGYVLETLRAEALVGEAVLQAAESLLRERTG